MLVVATATPSSRSRTPEPSWTTAWASLVDLRRGRRLRRLRVRRRGRRGPARYRDRPQRAGGGDRDPLPGGRPRRPLDSDPLRRRGRAAVVSASEGPGGILSWTWVATARRPDCSRLPPAEAGGRRAPRPSPPVSTTWRMSGREVFRGRSAPSSRRRRPRSGGPRPPPLRRLVRPPSGQRPDLRGRPPAPRHPGRADGPEHRALRQHLRRIDTARSSLTEAAADGRLARRRPGPARRLRRGMTWAARSWTGGGDEPGPDGRGGRVAFVTGGSRGIGRAVVLRLAAERSPSLLLVERRGGRCGHAAAAEEAGGSALRCAPTFADAAAVDAAFGAVEDALGPVECWSTTPASPATASWPA